jgi:hypothetical protein
MKKISMPIERLKSRLRKDRPMTSITVRMPQDVVESMKRIAPLRGLQGYQTLLKLYLSEGLRRDEALLEPPVAQLIRALIAQGVSAELIEQASQGIVTKR